MTATRQSGTGSRIRTFLATSLGRPLLRLGMLGIAAIALCADLRSIPDALRPSSPQSAGFQPPGNGHLLGTDQVGRDVLARILYGARIDLQIGVIGTLIPFSSSALSSVSWPATQAAVFDSVISPVIDVFAAAFPHLVLVIAIVAMLGRAHQLLHRGDGRSSWTAYARIIRGETLSIRGREHVLAAQTLGYSRARIIARHVLPNVIARLLSCSP